MVRQFRVLKPQAVSVVDGATLNINQAAVPLSATGRHIFVGTTKSPFIQHRFSSDPERRFAALIDSAFDKDVLRWLKPGRDEFSIEYHSGKTYEPDFVVETANEKLIVEIKSDAGKSWAYLLVPGSAIRAQR